MDKKHHNTRQVRSVSHNPQQSTSAKVQRHEHSKEKYKKYINKVTQDEKLQEQMLGKSRKDLIATPGQFMIVSNNRNLQRNRSTTQKSLASSKTMQQNKSLISPNTQNISINNNIPHPNSQHKRLRSAQTLHAQQQQQQQQNNYILSNTQIQQQQNSFHIQQQQQQQQQKRSHSKTLHQRLPTENSQSRIENLNDTTINNNIQKSNNFILNDSFVQHQQQEPLPIITKNLKHIVNRQNTDHMQKSSRIIQNMVDQSVISEGSPKRRITQNQQRIQKAQIQPIMETSAKKQQQKQSQTSNSAQKVPAPRPFSAKYIQSALQKQQQYKQDLNNETATEFFKDAINEDLLRNTQKIKTSYVIQNKKPQIKSKHIQGYKTIQLTKNDFQSTSKTNITSQSKFKKELHTAIDQSKQSPFIFNNLDAEKIISKQLNLPTQASESNNLEQDQERKKGYFLPLDYYNLDQEDYHPEIIMEKYKDPTSGDLYGYSKWQLNNGEFEWRRCKVIEYQEKQERYKIEWQTGKQKLVSRINLRFEREHEDEFQKKLQAAEYYREMSEIYMKYNYMIDSLDCDSLMTQQQIEKILIFVANNSAKLNPPKNPLEYYSLNPGLKYAGIEYVVLVNKLMKNCNWDLFYQIENVQKYLQGKTIQEISFKERQLLQKQPILGTIEKSISFIQTSYKQSLYDSLIKEIQLEFQRAQKKIQFDIQLPYSEDKKKLFQGVLPDQMFLSILDLPTKELESFRGDNIDITDHYQNLETYLSTFQTIQQTLNRADPQLLEKLFNVNKDKLQLESHHMIPTSLKLYQNIDSFSKHFKIKYKDVITDLQHIVYDHSYELGFIVDQEKQQQNLKNQELKRRYVTEEKLKGRVKEGLSPEFQSKINRIQNCINYQYEQYTQQQFKNSMDVYFDFFFSIIKEYLKANFLALQTFDYSLPIEQENNTNNNIEMDPFIRFLEFQKYSPIFHQKLTCCCKLQKNEKSVSYDLDISLWIQAFQKVYDEIVKDLQNVQCMKVKEFKPSRFSQKLKIFENSQDPLILLYQHKLQQVFQQLQQMSDLYLQKIQQDFGFLVKQEQTKKKFEKARFSDIENRLKQLRNAQDQMNKLLFQDKIQVGFLLVDTSEFRQHVKERIQKDTKILYEILVQKIKKKITVYTEEIDALHLTIEKLPQNIEEMDQMRQYCNGDLIEKVIDINQRIQELFDSMNLAQYFYYKIDYQSFQELWQLFALPGDLLEKKDEYLMTVKNLQNKLSEELIINKKDMIERIKILKLDFEELQMRTELEELDEIYLKFYNMYNLIQQMTQQCDVINKREKILKWELTDFTELDKIFKAFNPYYRVWHQAKDYSIKIPNVMQGPIIQIQRDLITKEIQESWEELYKLEKNEFKQEVHMKKLTQTVRLQYEGFKPYLPLINDLRNPCMEKANWKALNNVIEEHNKNHNDKKQIPLFDEEFQISLEFLVQNNIMLIQDDIREISEISTKERGFEKILYKMKQEWKPVKLTLVPYKASNTHIIKSVDFILDKLDEDIAKILSIASSPFVKFMESEVSKWRQQLQQMQEHIELWIKAQKLWQYLQPIFQSEDIYKELPKEGSKFQQTDKTWRFIMDTATATPNCMDACFQSRLKENLLYIIDTLDHVVKGLNLFLNKKRQAFPRFYFLSNDELLQILSQTKEVRLVQNHLPKCFEGIDKLTFQDQDNLITHFNSALGEQIEFLTPTDPIYKELKQSTQTQQQQQQLQQKKQKRPSVKPQQQEKEQEREKKYVEEWLLEIEKNMKSTLFEILKNTIKDSQQQERTTWLLKWPSQIVICTDQILWTSSVTEAIHGQKSDQKSLQYCYNTHKKNLLEIVDLVRKNLNKIDRITLGCLVTLEVHANDVIQSLQKENIFDDQAFEWLAQMRYYQKVRKLEVQMVSTTRDYGFEYLGNQGRLVITQLTDRCYRTLMSALQQNLGGAPEGPAGTGKTETTKDLAKAIGKHCVVFNCSDAIDYLSMAKFFKGLCSCGSWACFDEFNRIDLEVLSVIASQILVIQTNILKQRNSGQYFDFEGDSIPLDSSCAIFITMNPGYAGRSELPDNLKALFRPVAMMIPNYSLITEISLYSFGFVQARDLSVKITSSLKLASEQLSTQSHYDYGMRAVKSIITAAGNLKRQYPDEKEPLIVLKAISDCNLPKFTSKDVPLFQAIINDLFPQESYQNQDYGALEDAIIEICHDENLILKPRFKQKIFELYETIQVRHGLMLVGQTNSGKSSILNTLSTAIEFRNFDYAYDLQDPEDKMKLETEWLTPQEEESPTKKRFQMGESPLKKRKENILLALKKEESLQNNSQEQQHHELTKEEIINLHKKDLYHSNKHNIPYQKVQKFQCNPKAISIKLLFGDIDDASGDWQDGITALMFRQCQEQQIKEDMKWVVFDGPVDALWIENMNTVLDDNQKLCLANGETIKMAQLMNIIFEVEDLLEASPATVSRCGMVFMENKDLGYQVYYQDWYHQIPSNLNDPKYIEFYETLFSEFLPSIFSSLSQIVKNPDEMWLTTSFLNLFECFLLKNQKKSTVIAQLEHEQEKKEAKMKAAKLQGNMAQVLKEFKSEFNEKTRGRILASFIQAITWSCGAILETQSQRQKFNLKFLQLIQQKTETHDKISQVLKKSLPFAQDNDKLDNIDLFSLHFDYDTYNWAPWLKNLKFKIPNDLSFQQIFVPTTDSIRHKHILKILTQNSHPCLFLGKTGTGKTMITKDFLMNSQDETQLISITSFSANTTASQVQDILESKLEKQKRSRGVLGPLIGYKNVIFVDDLNMPNKQRYGAQPPLELIRQWFSQGGWYDRKTLEFNKIIDIQFCAAMGPGRPSLSKRLLRNFNPIYLNDLQEDTLNFMISKIMDWGFQDAPTQVQQYSEKLTKISIDLANKVSQSFLPLPKKSHYLFNLRDLMKLLQGILQINNESYPIDDSLQINQVRLQRVWLHEATCVYKDRLVDDKDQIKFNEIIDEILKETLFTSLQDLLDFDTNLIINQQEQQQSKDLDLQQQDQNNTSQNTIKNKPKHIIFTNFISDYKYYEELFDLQKAKEIIHDHITNYNQIQKKKIDIILFEDAIHLYSKLNRIITQPQGNALLIGLGGSGSKTLTRLATFTQQYKLYELEIEQDFSQNNWYEFLKEMLQDIVLQQQTAVFMLSDPQIIQEQFLEDLNNLINIGEIPNLFTPDEKEQLIDDLRELTLKKKMNLNFLQLWQYFIDQCKQNLHIVLNLSPIGQKLRLRLRNFPSLVSCTSPIWIQPWSENALNDVSVHTLQKCAHKLNLQQEQIYQISDIVLGMHKSVENIIDEYYKETSNRFYVTETMYLKLIKTFEQKYSQKLQQMTSKRLKYTKGIQKLDDCEEVVKKLQEDLTKLQPILLQKTKEIDQMMINVKQQNQQAEQQRVQVIKDEEDTREKAQLAESIQKECKDKLSVAEPKLEQAIEALKTLKVEQFVEIKSFKKPPQLIYVTMESICIMMGCNGKKNPQTGQLDFWEDAKKLLNDPQKFIQKLEKYDRDNIPDSLINKLTTFFKNHPEYQPKVVAKASKAAEGLCLWCKAIYDYHFVYKSITPLRQDLSQANKNLLQAEDNLKLKLKELQEVEDKCHKLKMQYDQAVAEKFNLQKQVKDCETKKDRALILVQNLSGEKIRWGQNIIQINQEVENLLGDILLTVGSLAYMGAFTSNFRQKILHQHWIPIVKSQNIICNENFSLLSCIGNPIEIQEWLIYGLPLDEVSKENALIMKESPNWPLILDPQGQATHFIKSYTNRYDENALILSKPGKQLDIALQTAIRHGKTILIENCQETLDPSLEYALVKDNVVQEAGQKMIQIGQESIPYDDNFRLYLVCNLPSPHYTPEVLTKVTLLNFNITFEGLKDQMSSILIREEDPKISELRIKLMEEHSENQQKLHEMEEKILELLNQTEGHQMLEDETLIDSLKESKSTSQYIEERMKEYTQTEDQIKRLSISYTEITDLASHIYFSILQLRNLDYMYQFSLSLYIQVFKTSIKLAERPHEKNPQQKIKLRSQNIIQSLKKQTFKEINRSIFVKHKMLFNFILAITDLKRQQLLNDQNYSFLISGISGQPLDQSVKNPFPSQITQKQWTQILELNNLETYKGLPNLIQTYWQKPFKNFFQNPLTHIQPNELPDALFNILQPFNKLVLIKSIRPDLFVQAMQNFVQQTLGDYFIQNHSITIQESFQESSATIPLIYVLSPGDDPQEEVKKMAQEHQKYLTFVSLGKGQGQYAEEQIREAVQTGQWVLLQNCHLAVSWLPRLEQLLEEITILANKKDKLKKFDPEFRLWLTSSSTPSFPLSLLQISIKMTKDPPKGIKSNILQLYENMNTTKEDRQNYENCKKKEEWKKLLMALSFFHSIVRERRRFGPIGWNIYYDFNNSDFLISSKQLKSMLNSYQEIPFKALIYLTGQCYYGGKVTDDWDRRVLDELLKDFYTPNLLQSEAFTFSKIEELNIPNVQKLENLLMAIDFVETEIPDRSDPEIFGLHESANISSATYEQDFLINCLLQTQSSSSNKSQDSNQIILQRAQQLLESLPPNFDTQKVSEKYEITYYESMNTVLLQEILRYNNLLTILSNSLKDLIQALQGFQVMTSDLDSIAESIINNKIPQVWLNKSYPSLKPLMSYHEDLIKRTQMFQTWIDTKMPNVFWISGFYFTQSFFTGVRQNYARKLKIPIDQIQFDFDIIDTKTEKQIYTQPDIGCYINGLFLEGAQWDSSAHTLAEPDPKTIYSQMPIIQLIPTEDPQTKKNIVKRGLKVYECPVYKTIERKGTLSTTGHSTNFILAIDLKTREESRHWVKRGVALLSQLND